MLSFIIVTHNSERFIGSCLRSIVEKAGEIDFEIVIKDNDSEDATTKIIKDFMKSHDGKIKLIESTINNGFTGGNNDTVKLSSGELLFFLNADTILNSYDHNKVLEFFKQDRMMSIIQPKLKKMLAPDIVESTGHYIDALGNAYIENENEKDRNFKNKRIFAATGSSFIMRKEIFNKLKGFDDDFFILYEETDLCWRNNLMGYRAYYMNELEVYHFGSGALNKGIERGKVINYKMTYFYLRNKIISGIKNIKETDLLLIFLLGNLLIYIVSSLSWLFKRFEFKYFKAVWLALLFIIFNYGKLLEKRRINIATAKCTNRELIDSGMIMNFDISKWLSKVLTNTNFKMRNLT